jgi:hypothetical protein
MSMLQSERARLLLPARIGVSKPLRLETRGCETPTMSQIVADKGELGGKFNGRV